jgi:hypothetical protein
MRRYLLDHASDYIDAHRHFANKRARMTDQERDEIDEVRTCAPLHPVHNRTRKRQCVAHHHHSYYAGDEHMHARVL